MPNYFHDKKTLPHCTVPSVVNYEIYGEKHKNTHIYSKLPLFFHLHTNVELIRGSFFGFITAPEILGMEPITLAADIWSLGVAAYVLLTGFSPFGGDTDQETLRNITTATLDFPEELFEGVTELAKEFISLCLCRDPT